jgi:hypothetical protein
LNPNLIADLIHRIIKNASSNENGEVKNEDWDEDAIVLRRNRGNAILVFLSGLQAIESVQKAIRRKYALNHPNIHVKLSFCSF